MEPDKAMLDELDKRFNGETNLVNVYTGSLLVGNDESEPEEQSGDEQAEDEGDTVNLAYYRDDEDPDSDPGND
jgi:hypothetical protein